jgi:hypothetical protein
LGYRNGSISRISTGCIKGTPAEQRISANSLFRKRARSSKFVRSVRASKGGCLKPCKTPGPALSSPTELRRPAPTAQQIPRADDCSRLVPTENSFYLRGHAPELKGEEGTCRRALTGFSTLSCSINHTRVLHRTTATRPRQRQIRAGSAKHPGAHTFICSRAC